VTPKALFILPIALIVAVVLAWKGFKSVSGGFGTHGEAKAAEVAVGASDVSGGAAAPRGQASDKWRVAGQYAIDARGYVLLADKQGHFRRESADDFKGDTLGVTGTVDGERVAVWTGGVAGSDNAIVGRK
jgi:zona occludens toxin